MDKYGPHVYGIFIFLTFIMVLILFIKAMGV